MSKLTRTALAIDRDLLASFDKWMAANGYSNRSEAVRDLIRAALVESTWADPDAQDLAHKQHHDHDAVLCSQHVHLDAHQCLEVILMRGKAARLRQLADRIIATKGVLAGKISIVSENV